MNINLKLSGIAEKVIEEMIAKGYAANKTEAIRITVLDYKQHHMEKDEKEFLSSIQKAKMKELWDNKVDEV